MCRLRILFIPLLLAGLVAAEDSVRVTVEISGLTSRIGQVVLQVYEDPDTFLQTPSAVILVPLAGQPEVGPVSVEVDLPPRPVAVCAYHDRNADGQIDRTTIGVPTEPYGWSRGVHPKWMPPSWDEVVIRPGAQDPDRGLVPLTLRDW